MELILHELCFQLIGEAFDRQPLRAPSIIYGQTDEWPTAKGIAAPAMRGLNGQRL